MNSTFKRVADAKERLRLSAFYLTLILMLLLKSFLFVTAAAAQISLQIAVDKVFLLPAETQFATVTAVNSGQSAATITVSVVLTWNLTDSRDLNDMLLNIPAGGHASSVLAFPAGPGLFGYEVKAFVKGDETISPVSAYFSVHYNIWQTSMQGSGLMANALASPLQTDAYRASLEQEAHTSLCNQYEFFAWAPDDFSTLEPDANVWYSGQTSTCSSKLGMHEAVDALHEAGVCVSAYAKGQMGGPAAMEYFREHPVWAGAPYNSKWDVMSLEQFDSKTPFDTGLNTWPRSMTDFGSWPVAYLHIQQLRMAAEDFRFDAVRYDDQLQVGWVNEGYNPMTARNMEQITTRLRTALPFFGFGFNWILGSEKSVWEKHGGQPFPDWPIAGAAGSQIMDEEIGQIFGSSRPAAGLPWSEYLDRLKYDRDLTEQYGGKTFIMQNQKLPPTDAAYRNALVLAMRLYHTNFDNSAPFNFARFATRYGFLLRSDHPDDLTTTDFKVESPSPIWTANLAYKFTLPHHRGIMVVQFINPPGEANIGEGAPFPPPIHGVQLHVNAPPGWTIKSAESIDAASLTVTDFPASGSTLDWTEPDVTLWTLVAIVCDTSH